MPEVKKYRFFDDVYEVVKLIPRGRVTNYGSIGRYLGSGISARMVGWAMNAAHGLDDVPAHRVVNSIGLLTGKMHFETPDKMQELLEAEGVTVKDNKVFKYKDYYWDPVVALDI